MRLARAHRVHVPGGDLHARARASVDRERRAAAAGRGRVRVAHGEMRAHQRVREVELGAGQQIEAGGVDHHARAVAFDRRVVGRGAVGELEAVLKARAAAGEHRHAQECRPPGCRATISPIRAAASAEMAKGGAAMAAIWFISDM